MVKLTDDWVILIDQYEYTLAKDTHKTQNINGKMSVVYKYYSYYGSLRFAMMGYREILIKEKLKGDVFTIDEAIKEIKEVDDQIKLMLMDVFEGDYPK